MLRMFKTAPGGFVYSNKESPQRLILSGTKLNSWFLAGLKGKAQDALCNWAAPSAVPVKSTGIPSLLPNDEAAAELACKKHRLRQSSRTTPHSSLAPRRLQGAESQKQTKKQPKSNKIIKLWRAVFYPPHLSHRGAKALFGVFREDCLSERFL